MSKTLKGNSHQILKLAERRIQGLVSSCRKHTVQPATEAENGPRVNVCSTKSDSLCLFESSYLVQYRLMSPTIEEFLVTDVF